MEPQYQEYMEMASVIEAPAYWINPSGKVLAVDTNHIDKVIKHPEKYNISKEEIEAIYKSENENVGVEGKAREKIIVDLIRQGWIRLRFYPRQAMWTANISRLNNRAKDCLHSWASNLIQNSKRKDVKYDMINIDTPNERLSASLGDIAQDYLYTLEGKKEKQKKDFKYFLEKVQ